MTTSLNGTSWPTFRVTGTSSPRPATIGWTTARTGRDDDAQGAVSVERFGVGEAGASTDRRRPTVSERGESRSCGRVSQLGNSATASGRQEGAQGLGQVLGFTAGRRDGEDHSPVPAVVTGAVRRFSAAFSRPSAISASSTDRIPAGALIW